MMEMKLHYVVRLIDKDQYEYIAGPMPYHDCINIINHNHYNGLMGLEIMSRVIPNCELV